MSETNTTPDPAIDRDNPWPGLATFTEEQSTLFFGRDEEIRDLTRRAERNALTILFGQSGLGKSSLLQAGVFPRLRASGYWPVYVRLDHAAGAPPLAEQIKTLVQTETARAGSWSKPGSAKPGESLWEFFHHRDDRLVSPSGRTIVPVLVFDQFEELFTLGGGSGSERERAVAFISELAELVENRPAERLVARLEESSAEMDAFDFSRTDYRVVITLREDFLPHLESLRTAMPALMENRMRLTRMSGTQALEAVVKPGGTLVTEEVARAIVEFVAGAKGGSVERLSELDVEPPLLSVICRELNERRRALGQSQITADLVSGNRREILTDFYERSVADLPAEMRAFVEDHLLTKSGFRDNLALETALEFPGVTRPLLDTLVARRLLRIEDRLGVQRVELTHDVLAEVIRASRDARQQRLALERTHATERQTRRRMWLARGIAAALLVALAGASWQAWRAVEGRRAETRRSSRTDLVLASQLLDEGKVGDGLAYLVRAARKDPDNTILGPRVLSTLASHNFLLPDGAPVQMPSPALISVRSSQDRRRIFVQGEDRVLRVISVDPLKLEREFSFGGPLQPYGWAIAEKNERVMAVELENGTLLVCDSFSGQPTAPPIQRPNDRRGELVIGLVLSLSPDGRWLATGDGHSVWIWDTKSGQLAATFPYRGLNDWGDYLFSPDSRTILTVHNNQLRALSVPDGALVAEFEVATHANNTEAPALFSPDGTKLLVYLREKPGVREKRGVQLFEFPSAAPVGAFVPLSAFPMESAFSADGTRYALAGQDGLVPVVEAASGNLVFPPLQQPGPAYQPQFSRDGEVLLVSSVDGLARVWDMASGRLLAEPTLQQGRYMPAALNLEGTGLVIFMERGQAQSLRIGRGAATPLALPRGDSTSPEIHFLNESPSRLLAFDRSRARVIDVRTGTHIAGGFAHPTALTGNITSAVRPLAMGQRQVGAGARWVARTGPEMWQIWTLGREGISSVAPLESLPEAANFVASRDGSRVTRTGKTEANTGHHVWSAETGQRVASITIERGNHVLDLSSDGRRIAFRTDDEVGSAWIWDLQAGKKLFQLRVSDRGMGMEGVAFSPDGTRIVGSDYWGGVYLWDANDGRMLNAMLGHRDIAKLSVFSPDGRYFATASMAGTAQVWTVAAAAPVGAVLSHETYVSGLAFSNDSTRVATTSRDGTARVWDVQSGQPVTAPLRHGSGARVVEAPRFSPDGRFLMTRTPLDPSAIWIWAVPPENGRLPEWLLQLASVCAGREVSPEGEFRGADDALARIADIKRELAALPDSAPYVEWARWFLSDSPTRSIAPGFTITPAEAKKLREEMESVAAPSTVPVTGPTR